MKVSIKDIESCTYENNRYSFRGGEGIIHIRLLSETSIRFEYEFSTAVSDSGLERSFAMVQDEMPFRPVSSRLQRDDNGWRIHVGEATIVIPQQDACVSVYRHGKLIHGGKLGNSDTVVPVSQVRYFSEDADHPGYARFNFPLSEADEFYGLGDKTGRPNRRGRRFAMFNRDALGYDATHSDPLYKSIPFMIKINCRQNVVCGIYMDSPSISCIDLGHESRFYYYWETKGGRFSYYLFMGDGYRDIVREYCTITGFPALPPLFSFGFFGSSMNYTEPDDAAERIQQYFKTVEAHDIPCEGMYVSSGYLKHHDGKRYAFLWNRQKFPDYGKYLKSLTERGYNLCMNIKPGILTTHPWYAELASKGYFIKDKHGESYQEFFWGGMASLVDFMNPEAVSWWKSQLNEQYLEHGCTGIWNDNNEFEIEDPEVERYRVRTLLPVLMAKASFDAMKDAKPEERPWIYSRSGYSGIQNYARSWTGDNVSDWTTLKYNQYMGVGLGLSAMPFFGHDLGGFFGEIPTEELLIRSCQSGVFQPRFVIHSWRENGEPTEPWTYKTALEPIRSLIREHYRFMPYIYSTAFQAALEGTPMDRSLHLEFPQDPMLVDDLTYSMFGDSVLKASVVEEQTTSISIRFPQGVQWYEGETGRLIAGGTERNYESKPDGTHLWFAKAGSAIATSGSTGKLVGPFKRLDFLVFPSLGEIVENRFYEDDGKTDLILGRYNQWNITVSDTEAVFTLHRKGFGATGRLFAVHGHTFDPDALREHESVTIPIRNRRDS